MVAFHTVFLKSASQAVRSDGVRILIRLVSETLAENHSVNLFKTYTRDDQLRLVVEAMFHQEYFPPTTAEFSQMLCIVKDLDWGGNGGLSVSCYNSAMLQHLVSVWSKGPFKCWAATDTALKTLTRMQRICDEDSVEVQEPYERPRFSACVTHTGYAHVYCSGQWLGRRFEDVSCLGDCEREIAGQRQVFQSSSADFDIDDTPALKFWLNKQMIARQMLIPAWNRSMEPYPGITYQSTWCKQTASSNLAGNGKTFQVLPTCMLHLLPLLQSELGSLVVTQL